MASGSRSAGGRGSPEGVACDLRHSQTTITTSANQSRYFVISRQPHRAFKHSRSAPEQDWPAIKTKQRGIKAEKPEIPAGKHPNLEAGNFVKPELA
jgi:hypothetical protein